MLLEANRKISTRWSTTCRFTGQCTSVMPKLLILLSAKGHLQLSTDGARDSKGLKGTEDIDERECLSNYKNVNLHFYKSGMASLSHRKGSATWIARSPLQRTGISQLTSLDQPMFPLCYLDSARNFYINSLPFYSPYHVNRNCFYYLTLICWMFSPLNGYLHRALSRSKWQSQ